MNYFDLGVLLIFIFFLLNGYVRGFVKSVFGLASTIIAIVFAYFAYPYVSKMLINSFLYENVKEWAINSIGLESLIEAQTVKLQTDFIANLQLPDLLINSIMSNNNPVFYDLLKVSGFENYIGGYVAGICMNILAIIIVFVIAKIGLDILKLALDFITKLPVISFVNRICGLIAGVFQAVIFIWICFTLMTIFLFNQQNTELYNMLTASVLAKQLYDNNLILNFILNFHF